MATPLTADRLLAALRAEGVKVVEVGNWRTHNRNHKGAWGPVHGVMIHHTVSKGTAATVALCRTGHSALPGPLCHGVIAKDGVVHLVGHGRTNHAGLGDDDVLQAVINETALPADNEANTDGNRHFYGFECENLGDGKDPWPAAQVEASVRASAAILRAHGWGKGGDTSVIGHSEWQPGKIDPRGPGITMGDIRRRVAERLRHPASWSPSAPKPPAPAPSPKPPTTAERIAALEKRVTALEKE
ncbi:N-acetylmuramoyl-L-alanine amidase [Streptomyces sp. NPDC002994]|uniref:N-acetylmuramoyl-L-alanine amidase n=1 Tax=Streptomyces sp. NPDC002994 TaxID=3154441 RepID=UPI0033AAFD67